MSDISYTYWILPDEKTQSELQTIVTQLATEYSAPIFEPHMTLLGGVTTDKNLAIKNLPVIAEQLRGMNLSLGRVEYSTTYYQSVFVRVNATVQLMSAYVYSRDLFQQDKDKVFMPHISLLYGNHSMEIREEATKKVELITSTFKASKVCVTPFHEDPSQWEHIIEADL